MAFSAHISGDHNPFPGTSLQIPVFYRYNIFKLNGLNSRDKISFGAMPSPNIPSLTVMLEKLSDKLCGMGENGSTSVQCLASTS